MVKSVVVLLAFMLTMHPLAQTNGTLLIYGRESWPLESTIERKIIGPPHFL